MDDKIKEVMGLVDNLRSGDSPAYQRIIRAEIETKLRELVKIPPGYALVPVEPTEEMARAFRAEDAPSYFFMTTIKCADFSERYSAMLAAAQKESK